MSKLSDRAANHVCHCRMSYSKPPANEEKGDGELALQFLVPIVLDRQEKYDHIPLHQPFVPTVEGRSKGQGNFEFGRRSWAKICELPPEPNSQHDQLRPKPLTRKPLLRWLAERNRALDDRLRIGSR